MIEFFQYAFAGSAVGFFIGLTGVGGGSFMTPILLAFGFAPAIAVGTDLLYAAITKAGGVAAHYRQKTVEWRVVALLSSASIPASIATLFVLRELKTQGIEYEHILTTTLGVMLILTAALLFSRSFLSGSGERALNSESATSQFIQRHATLLTVLSGLSLGILVTLSSIGAGAFGAAVLMVLYPRMSMIRVIGTDLAHAVPLTAIAGLGHMQLGHVDFYLLACLMVGSLPAIWLGTKFAKRIPEHVMRPAMATVLMIIGLLYAIK